MPLGRDEIEKALPGVEFSALPTADQVCQTEERLGITFPADFREFLLTVGSLWWEGEFFSAIYGDDPFALSEGSLYGDTLGIRSELSVPMEYAIIDPNPDAPFAVNCNDGAVYVFDPDGATFTKISDSFSSHFQEWLEMRKES